MFTNKNEDSCKNIKKLSRKALLIGALLVLPLLLLRNYIKNPANQAHALFSCHPTITSYQEVQSLFDSLTDQDVCIFAIDDTLTYPEDQAVQHVENDGLRRAVFKKHPDLVKPLESEKVLSLIMAQAGRPLIEPCIKDHIAQLKAKNVHVLALSKLFTGGYGKIERLEVWRYEMLKNAGLDFQCPEIPEDLVFTTFAPFKHNNVRYYKGILCTHDRTKGEALGAYLDALSLKPRKLIFFDNRADDLDSVKKACTERGLEALCYYYKGAESKYAPVLDIKRAVFQVDHLIKYGSWLNDHEATLALKETSFFSTAPDYERKKGTFTQHKAQAFMEKNVKNEPDKKSHNSQLI